MIKKLILTTILFITTVSFTFAGELSIPSIELPEATKFVESYFSPSHKIINDDYSCFKLMANLKKNNWNYYFLTIASGNYSSFEEAEKVFSKRIKKFIKLNLKKINKPEYAVIIWCEKPCIKSYEGLFWGQTFAIIIPRGDWYK